MNWVKLGFLGYLACTLVSAQQSGTELNSQGLEAASKGAFADAERLYGEAIKVWIAGGPQFEAHLAITQANLAQAMSVQGKRSEAVPLFEEALTHYRHTLGTTHIHFLTCMNLLAGTYLMLGEDDRARALFREILPVEQEKYPDSVQLARTLSGLGLLLLRENKPEEALPLAEKALALAVKSEGEDSLDAALAYANIGETRRFLGQNDRAFPLLRKSRALYEKILGPTHPRVASLLSQEGLLLMEDGKLSLAEKAMRQSLDTLSKYCPGCGFELFVSESNLGLLRMKQGKYTEADRLLTHVLSMEETYLNHPGSDMAATLMALAQIRQKERRYTEAATFQKRADLIMGYR